MKFYPQPIGNTADGCQTSEGLINLVSIEN